MLSNEVTVIISADSHTFLSHYFSVSLECLLVRLCDIILTFDE